MYSERSDQVLGHFEFTRMASRLSNVAQAFQEIMQEVTRIGECICANGKQPSRKPLEVGIFSLVTRYF